MKEAKDALSPRGGIGIEPGDGGPAKDYKLRVNGLAAVTTRKLLTPPVSPSAGERFIIGSGSGATGAWAGHDIEVTRWSGTAWEFYAPVAGWQVYVDDEDATYLFNGAAWNKQARLVDLTPGLDLVYYVASTGNDATGDGSIGNPFRQMARAEQEKLKHLNPASCTVYLADAGPFTVSPFRCIGERLVVIGHNGTSLVETTIGPVRTVATATVEPQTIQIQTQASDAFDIDALLGNTIKMLTGASAGQRRTIRGHQPKYAVKAASTVALTHSGAQTIDGIACVAGDVVGDFSNTVGAGKWVVANGAWTRFGDADDGYKLNDAKVFVTSGTANGNKYFYQTRYNLTVDTHAQEWTTNDTIITPLAAFTTGVSHGDTFQVVKPLAEIRLPLVGGFAFAKLFVGYPVMNTAGVLGCGAFLVNVRLTSPVPGAVVFESCGVAVFGLELDAASHVAIERDGGSFASGLPDALVFVPGSSWMSAFGVGGYFDWRGWGTNAQLDGALNAPSGQSSLMGYFVLGFYGQGTSGEAATTFAGARLSGSFHFKQGTVVIQNSLVVKYGLITMDMCRMEIFEGGTGVLITNLDPGYDAVYANNNSAIAIRVGALHGFAPGAAFNVGATANPAGPTHGGGSIVFDQVPAVSGALAFARLHKGDYPASYFDAGGKGAIDATEPYATGGRIARSG